MPDELKMFVRAEATDFEVSPVPSATNYAFGVTRGGSIIFQTAGETVIEARPGGIIIIRGERIEDNRRVYEALSKWAERAGRPKEWGDPSPKRGTNPFFALLKRALKLP